MRQNVLATVYGMQVRTNRARHEFQLLVFRFLASFPDFHAFLAFAERRRCCAIFLMRLASTLLATSTEAFTASFPRMKTGPAFGQITKRGISSVPLSRLACQPPRAVGFPNICSEDRREAAGGGHSGRQAMRRASTVRSFISTERAGNARRAWQAHCATVEVRSVNVVSGSIDGLAKAISS